MTVRRDAALAILALLALGVALARRGVAIAPAPAVGGALGTLLFEVVAGRYHDRVRRLWNRPGVQALALGCALVVAAAAARGGARTIASVFVGALVAYLCLLAFVAAGLLAPPRDWLTADGDR